MAAVLHVSGAGDARALAAVLNGTDRDRPTVVVSVPAAADAPYIDPEEIARDVGDLAEVHLIRTGPDTFAFSDSMPDLTQVYGGAGRVYPVGTEWVRDPYRSPLRFALSASQGATATRALIADALRMAGQAGLTPAERHRALPRRTGEVRGLPTPDRAFVRLDDGFATIVQELTLADVPLARVVAPGMRVSGWYDAHSGRLDIRSGLRPAAECLRHYRVGDLVLAQVTAVGPDTARLMLHPDVTVAVQREDVTSNDLDELTSLMSSGEVLTARVVATAPGWRLSLVDVDDDEAPCTAASLLPGGPPWLQTPDVAVDVPAPMQIPAPPPAALAAVPEPDVPPVRPEPATTLPRPTPAILDRRRREVAAPPKPAAALRSLSLALDEAKAARLTAEQERDRLAAEVRALQGERALAATHIDSLTRQLEHGHHQLEQARTSRRKAARRPARVSGAVEHGRWFLDPEDQFRFEVDVAWARRIPAAEKAQRPLREYAVGPEFLGSVDAITGVGRDKIVDVVVEVVTGLAFELAGRDVHPLRTDEGGNSPQVVRAGDGAGCWRVSLQQDAPQARRLHYWQRHGGTVELSRVALHDDYTP